MVITFEQRSQPKENRKLNYTTHLLPSSPSIKRPSVRGDSFES